MPESDVIANQKQIIENQKTILSNQQHIQGNQETIKANQEAIKEEPGHAGYHRQEPGGNRCAPEKEVGCAGRPFQPRRSVRSGRSDTSMPDRLVLSH